MASRPGTLRVATYRIHAEIDAVTADVTLTGQVPSWRPETGHILFGDDQPKLFAWLPSVGFDGAYMRFTGQVTVERTGSDPVPETVTAPALWELMYFGKTTG